MTNDNDSNYNDAVTEVNEITTLKYAFAQKQLDFIRLMKY